MDGWMDGWIRGGFEGERACAARSVRLVSILLILARKSWLELYTLYYGWHGVFISLLVALSWAMGVLAGLVGRVGCLLRFTFSTVTG